jgi:hypothetical protein
MIGLAVHDRKASWRLPYKLFILKGYFGSVTGARARTLRLERARLSASPSFLLFGRGRSSTVVQSSKEAGLSIEAITLGGLRVAACGVFEHSDRNREARRGYLSYIYYRALYPRFEADERLKK